MGPKPKVVNNQTTDLPFDKTFQHNTNGFHDYFGAEYGHFTDIFIPIFYLVFISIIISIIIFFIIASKIKNKYKFIILLAGFFITLISPIYLVISFYNFLPEAPRAFHYENFFRYESRNSCEHMWGPGYGWYFSIIGSILLLVFSIIYYREWKKRPNIELHNQKSQEPDLGSVEIMYPECKTVSSIVHGPSYFG